MSKLLRENETKVFEEPAQAHAFFEAQKKEDRWCKRLISVRVRSGDTPAVLDSVVQDVEDCPILIEDVKARHGWDKAGAPDDETIMDCMSGTGLTIKSETGMEMPMRAAALQSAFGRFGIKIESKAVRTGLEKDRKRLADLCNTALAIMGDVEATELIRDGMVTALNGPDYQVLPMADLMEALEVVMDGRFPGWELERSEASHEFALVRYNVTRAGGPIKRELNRLLRRHGKEEFGEDISIYIVLTTSDCYASSANLYPYILAKGTPVMIGSPLKHKHVDGNDILKFSENCDKVYTLFEDATKALDRLMGIRIEHPYDCFVHAAEAARLSKKAVIPAAEDFDLERPVVCTAYDVYMALWSVEQTADRTDTLITYHEDICRLQNADWEHFDQKRGA